MIVGMMQSIPSYNVTSPLALPPGLPSVDAWGLCSSRYGPTHQSHHSTDTSHPIVSKTVTRPSRNGLADPGRPARHCASYDAAA